MEDSPDVAVEGNATSYAGFPEFSFAFQPIVDAAEGSIYSYEALIRGSRNEPADAVLEQIEPDEMRGFDESARRFAIELATCLGIECRLNLNLLPSSLRFSDRPIRRMLEEAARCGLLADRIVLEVTEGEVIDDQAEFARLVNRYRGKGLKVAIDNFGAGYSGLNLLADFRPDMVKLDSRLVRGIQKNAPRQAIASAVIRVCGGLGIDVIAEGLESRAEYLWFRNEGVKLFQGYLLARPEFEQLPGFLNPES